MTTIPSMGHTRDLGSCFVLYALLPGPTGRVSFYFLCIRIAVGAPLAGALSFLQYLPYRAFCLCICRNCDCSTYIIFLWLALECEDMLSCCCRALPVFLLLSGRALCFFIMFVVLLWTLST